MFKINIERLTDCRAPRDVGLYPVGTVPPPHHHQATTPLLHDAPPRLVLVAPPPFSPPPTFTYSTFYTVDRLPATSYPSLQYLFSLYLIIILRRPHVWYRCRLKRKIYRSRYTERYRNGRKRTSDTVPIAFKDIIAKHKKAAYSI